MIGVGEVVGLGSGAVVGKGEGVLEGAVPKANCDLFEKQSEFIVRAEC
jgi:hypothetical protein